MKIFIKCCKDCKPPRRKVGCHATCKDYIDEKAEIDNNKEELKKQKCINKDANDFIVGNIVHRKKEFNK